VKFLHPLYEQAIRFELWLPLSLGGGREGKALSPPPIPKKYEKRYWQINKSMV
jgi:hypothetical protein